MCFLRYIFVQCIFYVIFCTVYFLRYIFVRCIFYVVFCTVCFSRYIFVRCIFTCLQSEAFEQYDFKYCVTARKFIRPSFNEIRHILNLAQINAIAGGLRLYVHNIITFIVIEKHYDDYTILIVMEKRLVGFSISIVIEKHLIDYTILIVIEIHAISCTKIVIFLNLYLFKSAGFHSTCIGVIQISLLAFL